MNGLPYYKAYPRDFIEGTIGMPFELKATYRLLLDLIYMQNGRLPDDPRYISGLLGCSVRAWNKHRQGLLDMGKITVENGFISNFRADKELESLRTLQEKQAENARGPRKNNKLQKPPQNHTEPEPETEEEDGDGSACARDPDPTFREQILEAMGHDRSGTTANGQQFGTQADMAEVERWLELPGITKRNLLEEIRRVAARRSGGPPSSFNYFQKPIQRLSGELTKPALTPLPPERQKGSSDGNSKSAARFNAFIGGAIGAPPMDSGQDSHPAQPLLAGRRSR